MDHQHYDAIVVGGRCAGAATAMLLARGGLRVLVVEAARPGTDTLSTHALMRGGVLQLHRWGLLDAAVAEGARLVEGRVTGVSFDGRRASGVTVEGAGGVDPEGAGIIAADAVVIAMGPWSLLASQWLPLPPVYGLKGHSFVLQSSEAIPAQALFVEYEAADGQSFTPEIVPRADGTTYVCGVSSQSPLPLDPAAVAADAGAHERLLAMTARIAPGLGRAAILKTQTCFRPVTVDGLPFIGAVPGVPGAFVATGHSVWGMLNAPATAEALAGLIVEGKSGGVALSAFDPARMEPMAAGART